MTNDTTFQSLGISKTILDTLTRNRFTIPTPIQAAAIPLGIAGKDLIGIAQTGTGKTLAFGVPMIQRIGSSGGNGLVVVPTRELAQQVEQSIQKIGRPLGVRSAVLIGGEAMGKQLAQLRGNPHIIIATPGRLLDHLEHKSVNLIDVCVLVMDEADRMLDMGFAPQIKRILQSVPKDRQTMLFSATMPKEILKIASQYMRMPVNVEVAPAGTAAERVTHELFVVRKEAKIRLLEKLLQDNAGTVLVFSRTKFGAKKITATLRRSAIRATEIHSNRSLNQRREALEGFKRGKYRVLVATDIAARGIDVSDITLVINFDLPENPEDYVHRIGRTGRAGKEGHAISFAMPDQQRDVRDIERLIRATIPVTKLPDLPAAERVPNAPVQLIRETRAVSDAVRSFERPERRNDRGPRRPFTASRGANNGSRPPRGGGSTSVAGASAPRRAPGAYSPRDASARPEQRSRFGVPPKRGNAPFHSTERKFFGPGAPSATTSSSFFSETGEREPRSSHPHGRPSNPQHGPGPRRRGTYRGPRR